MRDTQLVNGPEHVAAPGWDAKVIAEVAKRRFGNLTKMFEHHGWPERGQEMMPKVQTRVVESYGSIKAFENHFAPREAE